MSDYDNNMWNDYDHYMHTGENAEYFEDEYSDEYFEEADNTETVRKISLVEFNEYLESILQQVKEKERIIKEQRIKQEKEEQAKKNNKFSETATTKSNTEPFNTTSEIKKKNDSFKNTQEKEKHGIWDWILLIFVMIFFAGGILVWLNLLCLI